MTSESGLEAMLRAIWSEVLAVPQSSIARDASFFAIGGDSVSIMQVMARMNERLFGDSGDQEIPITDFFAYPTIASLARRIAGAGPCEPTPEAQLHEAKSEESNAIAIVGMAGRFPGARNVEELWQNLRNGVTSIRELSIEELAAAGIARDAGGESAGPVMGAPLEDISLFDAGYFNVTPREATLMSPEQRVLLECVEDALCNAGYGQRDADTRVGVYISAGRSFYPSCHASEGGNCRPAVGVAGLIANTSTATRISYLLNLRGPSLSIDTACSSSLVAVHLACRALIGGECEIAAAGGVSSLNPAAQGLAQDLGGMRSQRGCCRPFDDEADGTVFTSGAGAVILKRLTLALRDRDTIVAVIRGTAINNDGREKVGFTAPSPAGQIEVIRQAHSTAGVSPETIGYVETHGTGTRLGDPIEFVALAEAFRSGAPRSAKCALGTLKANLGHLEVAAGVVGLIKAALVIRHGELPPAIRFLKPNSEIDFASSPFYINTTLEQWPPGTHPRRAAVSSFGIGGTNAHAVLEEAPPVSELQPHHAPQLILVSGRTESEFAAVRARLGAYLRAARGIRLADVAFTLQAGRAHHAHRAFIAAETADEAARQLESAPACQPVPDSGSRPVVFLFPGQGSQRRGMGASLYEHEPVFREALDSCALLALREGAVDIRRVLYPPHESDTAPGLLSNTSTCQPALFAVEYATARLFMARGIRPDLMLGHSLGELVAACLAGVFSLEDALRVVCARGRLMERAPPGKMLSVAMAREALAGILSAECSVAAENGIANCVVSGPCEVIDRLSSDLKERSISFRAIDTSGAFHSAAMDAVLPEFRKVLLSVKFGSVQIPYLSNRTGQPVTNELVCNADYWLDHLRQCVEFRSCVQTLCGGPDRVFIEMGPGHVLSRLVRKTAALRGSTVIATDDEENAPLGPRQMLHAIGRIWCAGGVVAWQALNAIQPVRRIPLPAYPYTRKEHWLHDGGARAKDPHDFLYVPSWRRMPLPANAGNRYAGRPCVLFAEDDALSDALYAGLRKSGPVLRVQRGSILSRKADTFAIDPDDANSYILLLQRMEELCILPERVLWAWTAANEAEADRHLLRLMHWCQAFVNAFPSQSMSLCVLTRNATDVLGTEVIEPCGAALAAAAGAFSRENPGVSSRTIDVELATESTIEAHCAIASAVLAELASSSDASIAIRNGIRWVCGFEHCSVPRAPQSGRLYRDGGVYLVSGGTGGIGLALAEFLAENCRAKLALLSRAGHLAQSSVRSTEGPTGAAIRRMESLGSEVLVLAADVADAVAVRRAVQGIVTRFGRIDGVVHAAGIAGGGLVALKTPQMMRDVLAPKIRGIAVLQEALASQNLDFFVICSSLSAILTPPGHFDYAAANAFLDAFAYRHDRRGGTRYLSVNWDAWRDVGMAANTLPGAGAAGTIDTSFGLSREEGKAVFGLMLNHPRPQWIVSTRNPEEFRQMTLEWRAPHASAEPPKIALESRGPSGSAQATPEERQVMDLWCGLLGVDSVNVDDNFLDLGGDSLLLVELSQRIATSFGRSVSVRELMKAPTVCEMAGLLSTGRLTRTPAAGSV